MIVVLLGSPGVGKGTYAKYLTQIYGIPSISTGDIFRENVANGTDLGKEVQPYMERGELVPCDIVIDTLKERVKDEKDGYFLDGFPRTIKQAEALETINEEDAVLSFVADEEVIVRRLSGRRVCKDCGAVFHLKNVPPKVEGKCDKCGGELYQREDDKPETIRERLRAYDELTRPLKDFYEKKGILHEIDASLDINVGKDQIIGECRKVLDPIAGE